MKGSYDFTVEIIEDAGHYVKMNNPAPSLTLGESIHFFEHLRSLGFRFLMGNHNFLICEKLPK